MNKRLLVVSGEGIGNFVQLLPTIRTIKENLGYDIDYLHAFGSYALVSGLCPYTYKFYLGDQVTQIDPLEYIGMVSTYWSRQHAKIMNMDLLAKIYPLKMDEPEVETYLKLATDLGVSREDFIYEAPCGNASVEKDFDVVIADGFNRFGSADWSIKSYPYYKEVVAMLIKAGYTVCSVGSSDEYVEGTVNMTNRPLLESAGIIRYSKAFLGNDSGMYHVAASFGIPSVVIFTATSITKNYHPEFHKSVEVIGIDNLECRPCQAGRGWKKCADWKCHEIDPIFVFDKIVEKINAQ